jgi:prepilin signal peptidase PulO-like enzyme (type II secretory pathway)
MYNLAVICLCVIIALVDVKTYRIPDVLLVLFLPVILIPEVNHPHLSVVSRLIAALAAFIFFGAVWHYTQGMGFGDVKYAAVLGYILGPERLVQALIFTALLSMTIYIAGIFIFRWAKTAKIPFAPFLSAGAILTLGVIP